jgi:hypothetical protein
MVMSSLIRKGAYSLGLSRSWLERRQIRGVGSVLVWLKMERH